MKKRHEQKLIIISLLLTLIFNVPFLMAYNKGTAIVGIPVFYLFIFTVWACSILLCGLILYRHYD